MSISVVIADDLTGACEIAGIGHRAGLLTRLTLDAPQVAAPLAPPAGELLVLDTETRLLAPAAAATRLTQVAHSLAPATAVFKKTDSVLRGPVFAECTALARALGRRATLLIPANPALQRIVRHGRYQIADTPLSTTPFAHDPHHPATTDDVVALLAADPGAGSAASCAPTAPLPAADVIVGDAESDADLVTWAARISPDLLPAGSAAFFTHLLPPATALTPAPAPDLAGPTLLLSGTTTPAQRAVTLTARHAITLPAAERDVTALAQWCRRIVAQLAPASAPVIAAFTGPVQPTDDTPSHLSQCFATLAVEAHAAQANQTWHLVIEGGATAAAVATALGWRTFDVRHEWAPGVVALQPLDAPHVLLTLKPGSYPWPPVLQHHLFQQR